MFSVAWPWLLALLPLPLLLRLLLPAARPASSALRVPFFESLQQLARHQDGRRFRKRGLLLPALIWSLLVFAAMRPQWQEPVKTLDTPSRDLMLALDLSPSMRTRDMQGPDGPVSRLQAVQQLLGQLLATQSADRMGLIFFGSQAYLQAPLTHDHQSLAYWLESAETGIAGDSTAIGDAIGLSIKHLRRQPATQKNLVLLTDGASNSGIMPPRTAARFAAREGIRIFSIGVGQPGQEGSDGPDMLQLQDMAWLTGGRYLQLESLDSVNRLGEFFATLPGTDRPPQQYLLRELYRWPLLAALLLASLHTLWMFLVYLALARRERRPS